MILARITFPAGSAEFGSDLRWSATTPGLADALNTLADAEDDSPSRGRWWVAHAEAVATALGGRAEITPAADGPEGRIY